jgi:adenylate kinase
MMNLIILGPQGSGKGTQAMLIAKKLNLIHIDVGLALRQAARRKTKFGFKLDRIINKNKELVSDEIVRAVLSRDLKQISNKKGVILDGAPRRKDQIMEIEELLVDFGRKLGRIIYVKINQKESIQRISRRYNCSRCFRRYVLGKEIQSTKEKCPKCGGKVVRRVDDTPEGIKKRLSIFRKETLPVINHFKKVGLLLEVDGMKKTDLVFKDILDGLKKK